jgi:hypothetical protein
MFSRPSRRRVNPGSRASKQVLVGGRAWIGQSGGWALDLLDFSDAMNLQYSAEPAAEQFVDVRVMLQIQMSEPGKHAAEMK